MNFRPGRSWPPGEARTCLALVDASFLNWIQKAGAGGDEAEDVEDDEGGEGEPGLGLREGLREGLEAALAAAGVVAEVHRVIWYTRLAQLPPVAHQVPRLVPSEDQDGGAGLVLAMSRDALQAAESRSCAQILFVTDDDRLLPVVDALQARGLAVHVAADAAAADLQGLFRRDPGWAALLRQADTRLFLQPWQPGSGVAAAAGASGAAWAQPDQARRRERAEFGRGRHHEPAFSLDETGMRPLVEQWRLGLEEPERLAIAAELPTQRGLPAQADRSLLVYVSGQLQRSLTVPERKLMRALAREMLEPGSLEEAVAGA